MDKKLSRLRRARRTRAKIRELRVPRLTIHRTPRHIYAQVIDGDSNKVLAVASTVQADVKAKHGLVVEIMDQVKAAGVDRVSVAARG